MNTMRSLRATGRTTRMLADAIRLSNEGRAVYVVAANAGERERLTELLGDGWADAIKVETPESMGGLDWQTLRSAGMHPNCVVLVDHFAIESRFLNMITELHRYDPEDA